MFWARALAGQTEDTEIQSRFSGLAKELEEKENIIIEELNTAQGKGLDLGGYYDPDEKKVTEAMRPSATLNALISAFCG
jgi:isocitrate dehydrogenase